MQAVSLQLTKKTPQNYIFVIAIKILLSLRCFFFENSLLISEFQLCKLLGKLSQLPFIFQCKKRISGIIYTLVFLIFILQKQFVQKAFNYSTISGGIDKSALCSAETESQSQAQTKAQASRDIHLPLDLRVPGGKTRIESQDAHSVDLAQRSSLNVTQKRNHSRGLNLWQEPKAKISEDVF